MKVDDVKQIAVIGGGAMGHGIAQVCAMAGFHVVLMDVQAAVLQAGLAKIRESLDFLSNRGKLTEEEVEEIVTNRLTVTTNLPDAVQNAQVIIEAVPEIMRLKKQVFREIDPAAHKDAVLATNTSTMRISEIAEAVRNPARFAGMHFFNPVPKMKLVEVICGETTDADCADLLCDITRKMKKVPVKVLKDHPGFIVNRINAPNQALLNAILEEGAVKPDAVDNMMKRVGQPMGPFELADFVGLDVFYHTLSYYQKTLSPDYKPGTFLEKKVRKQALGQKTGSGIYQWNRGAAQLDPSASTEAFSPLDFLSIQINEAVRVFKEGLAATTQEIDEAIVHGMRSFAGPFAICSGLDPVDIEKTLGKLEQRFGLSIFHPEPEISDGSFKQMATPA